MELPHVDWVRPRFHCSARELFEQLAERIDADVKAMQALGMDRTFEANRVSDGKIMIVKKWHTPGVLDHDSVIVELDDHAIRVRNGLRNEAMFSAVPVFTKDAKCRLKVSGEGEPFEVWQVSQKALERLFFEEAR